MSIINKPHLKSSNKMNSDIPIMCREHNQEHSKYPPNTKNLANSHGPTLNHTNFAPSRFQKSKQMQVCKLTTDQASLPSRHRPLHPGRAGVCFLAIHVASSTETLLASSPQVQAPDVAAFLLPAQDPLACTGSHFPPLPRVKSYKAPRVNSTDPCSEMDKDHDNKPLHIRSAPVANIVIAKGIRTPLLPVMARPVHVAPALALAADPAPVEILQAARPRAARRRDEAVAPRAGILARVLWRREDGGGRTGRVLVRRRVDGRRRAVRVSRHQAGRVRAGELVVVVDERVLAHAFPFSCCASPSFLGLAQDLRSEKGRGAETLLRQLSPSEEGSGSALHSDYGGPLGTMPVSAPRPRMALSRRRCGDTWMLGVSQC